MSGIDRLGVEVQVRALRMAATAAALVLLTPIAPSAATGLAVPGGEDGAVSVTGERGDDGALTAKLEVTNTGADDAEITVDARDDDCEAEAAPTTAFDGRITTVAITLTCDEPATSDKQVAIVVGELDVEVTMTVDEPQQWWWLLAVCAVALVIGALLVVRLVRETIHGLEKQGADEQGRPDWEQGPSAPRPRTPVPTPVTWESRLTGAPTGWSFTDSWASTFTTAVALLTALFGSTDMLDALLGSAPDGVGGRLLVLAAIAALLVGLAPLVLAFYGDDTSTDVRGLTIAAVLTLTGTLVQLIGVPYLLRGSALWFPALVLAVLLAVALAGYARLTLRRVLVKSFPTPLPLEPDPEPSEALVGAVASLMDDANWSDDLVARLARAREIAQAYLRQQTPVVSATADRPIAPWTPYPPGPRGTSIGDDRTRTVLL
jgi:hypothetical protein